MKNSFFAPYYVGFLIVTLPLCAEGLAHGTAGNRFFPATIATEDPFVADELSLPSVSTVRHRAVGVEPNIRETEIEGELSKRLLPDLAISVSGAYLVNDPKGERTQSGFDNLGLGIKYQVFTSIAHEAIFSVGLDADVGRTGHRRVGAEDFSTLTPTVYFGKGFGDLPESAELLTPLALTGSFGIGLPTRARTVTTSINEEGDLEREIERHARTFKWNFALEYSLQYFSAFVSDKPLAAPFDRLIPLVEFALETGLDRGQSGRTTGTINPGFIWSADSFQLGVEALVPINPSSGSGTGVRGQIHFYLDDILPGIWGRPIFGRRS